MTLNHVYVLIHIYLLYTKSSNARGAAVTMHHIFKAFLSIFYSVDFVQLIASLAVYERMKRANKFKILLVNPLATEWWLPCSIAEKMCFGSNFFHFFLIACYTRYIVCHLFVS